MKRKKRDQYKQWRRRTVKIATILFIGMWLGFAVDWFFATYKFQAPIVKRVVSPVPDTTTPSVINNTEPGIRVITPKPTSTPTPTPKKRVSLHLAAPVQAAETSTNVSDEEIIAYIRSKDWPDDVAVALAKSENFWNKNKRFDCTRKGPINKDGSQDYGIFQINTIHTKTLASMGMTMDDMLDCKKNIDFAFEHVYTTRGNWSAWSAYNNGSYLNHL